MENLTVPNPEGTRGRQSYWNLEAGHVERAASQECGLLWRDFPQGRDPGEQTPDFTARPSVLTTPSASCWLNPSGTQ